MKLPYKIALIVVGAVLITSLAYTFTSDFTIRAFIGYYGVIGCGAGLLSLFISLLVYTDKTKRSYAQGFLLGGGIVLLTGIFALIYTISQIEFSR